MGLLGPQGDSSIEFNRRVETLEAFNGRAATVWRGNLIAAFVMQIHNRK